MIEVARNAGHGKRAGFWCCARGQIDTRDITDTDRCLIRQLHQPQSGAPCLSEGRDNTGREEETHELLELPHREVLTTQGPSAHTTTTHSSHFCTQSSRGYFPEADLEHRPYHFDMEVAVWKLQIVYWRQLSPRGRSLYPR